MSYYFLGLWTCPVPTILLFLSQEIVSLPNQVYKREPATYCLGQSFDGLASHPEGSSDTLNSFMLKKPG